MSSIGAICVREWQWQRRHWRSTAFVLAAPLLFAVAICGMYSHKKVTNIPVIIVDQDHSTLSRELTRAILANETFRLAGQLSSADDFPALAAEGRANVCFVFRRNLERDMINGKRAKIEVLVDNSNYLIGSVATASSTAVFGTYSIGTEVLLMEALHGIAQPSALRSAMPVELRQRMLFNPAFNSNYLNFMAAVFSFVPVQLASLLIAVRSGSSELEARERLSLPNGVSSGAIIAGKTLAHLCEILPVVFVTFLIPHWLLGMPFHALSFSFWTVMLWFVAIMVTLGFGLSCIAGDALFASEMCALLTLPNFLLSGVTWPVFAMPKIMWPLAYGFPMNSFAFMVKKITVMGGSLADCGNQLAAMVAWSVVAVLVAWKGARDIKRAAARGVDNHA
jgi:ABC-2 type transport system permease protein